MRPMPRQVRIMTESSQIGMEWSRRQLLRAACSLAAAPAVLGQKGKRGKQGARKKAAPAAKPENLVWPLPPEKPRIRYLQSLSGSLDVEPPKKKGFIARLINEDEAVTALSFERPAGIALDSRNRIYVTDTLRGAVFVFDLEGKKLDLLGTEGRGRLTNPLGIAIDSADRVYVSDVRQKLIQVYDPKWELMATIGTAGKERLVNPVGLAVDEARNRLLVVDSQAHKVHALMLDNFAAAGSVGKRGEEDDEFNYPGYVALGKDGTVYVSDTLNFCVKAFDPELKFLRRIGEHGTGVGMFDRPKGVALDSDDNLYVADASFSNVQIFNREGRLLLFIGSFGEGAGSFRLPASVFIDRSNRLLVADQVNRRVQIFQYLGGD